jgi:virginiamycin B lyase
MINPKKSLVYGIIAISFVVMAVTIPTLIRSPSNNSLAIKSGIQPIANPNSPSIVQFKNQFCGLNSIPNSNNYIMEYRLPHTCEMPLGIAVDNQAGKVWYVSTKQGVLGDYNLITKKFDKEISIPVWNMRKNPMDFSNVWSVKVFGLQMRNKTRYGDIVKLLVLICTKFPKDHQHLELFHLYL